MHRLSFRKIFYNNRFLFVFSLLAAVLFWFIIVVNISPNYTFTIGGVTVPTTQGGKTITYSGYGMVDLAQKNISVTVSGPRYLIGRLGADDFRVTPIEMTVGRAGTYDVFLKVDLRNPDPRLHIQSFSPRSVSVFFDKITKRALPITVDPGKPKLPDGYMAVDMSTNPASVTVTGPQTELGKLARAVVSVSVPDGTKGTVIDSGKVMLYTSDGKEADTGHLSLSVADVSVNVPVLQAKYLPVKVQFTNVPEGFNTSNITLTTTPANVLAASRDGSVQSLSELKLGSINFTSLNLTGNSFQYDIKLPDEIINASGTPTAVVNVSLKNTSSKIFSTGNLVVKNTGTNTQVYLRTKQISGVELFGPSSGIAKLTGASIEADVDMSKYGITQDGLYQVPVTIRVPGQGGYWVKQQYTAYIMVYVNG